MMSVVTMADDDDDDDDDGCPRASIARAPNSGAMTAWGSSDALLSSWSQSVPVVGHTQQSS
jgi:hypothetical protein